RSSPAGAVLYSGGGAVCRPQPSVGLTNSPQARLARLRFAGRTIRLGVMHPVILAIGASGGLGTSTLAAVTGAVLGRDHAASLVDTDFLGGGLDATVAIEHLDGLRWGDLAEHEGHVDAAALRRRLPAGPVP